MAHPSWKGGCAFLFYKSTTMDFSKFSDSRLMAWAYKSKETIDLINQEFYRRGSSSFVFEDWMKGNGFVFNPELKYWTKDNLSISFEKGADVFIVEYPSAGIEFNVPKTPYEADVIFSALMKSGQVSVKYRS